MQENTEPTKTDPVEMLGILTKSLPSLTKVTESRFVWQGVVFEMGFMAKDSVLEEGKRKEHHEYYFVIGDGKLRIRLEQRIREMVEGDHIHILPNEPHSVSAERDTEYIYVAFPPNGAN